MDRQGAIFGTNPFVAMKHIYAMLLCSTATGAWAQSAHPARPMLPLEKHGEHMPAVNMASQGGERSSYYVEEFLTGLDGWTVTNPLSDVPWTWTDVGPAPTPSIYQDPALNTTTGGWMMVDDDAVGTPGVSSETILTSPVIDLSAAPPNLKVEFDQYFQEFQLEHCFVGVSTDGGLTWSETEVNEGVGRDGRPNPELMDVNISAWVAMDPSNVQLHFRYTATWDYGWQIDNVRISDLPNNDVAVLSAFRTTFLQTTLEAAPYTISPFMHVAPMAMTERFKNKGYLPQTNVVATLTVNGPGGQEFTNSTAAIATLAPEQSDSAIYPDYIPSGMIGDYTADFTATQNETDEVLSNNSKQSNFKVSAGTYALDEGVLQDWMRSSLYRRNQAFEVGNSFEMIVDDQLVAVEVAVHSSTPVGSHIHGAVYNPATVANTPPAQIEVTEDHIITASDLCDFGGTTFITIPFTNPVPLPGGAVYQVMAGEYDASDSLRIGRSGFVPSQISTIFYPNAADTFELTFTRAPMVRAVLASGVGIHEQNALVNGVQAMPNPFADATDLRFELKQAMNVRVELRDMTGRLVVSEDLGKRGAGVQHYPIDGSVLSAGLYTYSLIANGTRFNGKLMRQH